MTMAVTREVPNRTHHDQDAVTRTPASRLPGHGKSVKPRSGVSTVVAYKKFYGF